MTINALSHVFQCDAPSPLAKLIMIYLADSKPGLNLFNTAAVAKFCCASEADVLVALEQCIDAGLVVAPAPTWIGLAYVEPEPVIQRPSYIKKVLPAATRRRIFQRDGNACVTCKSEANLTLDHIVPEKHGGSHDDSNLQTLCRSCNSRKGARV